MSYITLDSNIPVVNMHEAKTHLSAIVDEVKRYGKPIIIAKAGKPQVQVMPIADEKPKRKMGFMLDDNQSLPTGFDEFDNNFDSQLNDEIATLFSASIFPTDVPTDFSMNNQLEKTEL